MARLKDEPSEEASADYEVTFKEGECVGVGWSSDERQALYKVENEEPLHEDSFWSGLKSIFE